jgi:hypothetical protein
MERPQGGRKGQHVTRTYLKIVSCCRSAIKAE